MENSTDVNQSDNLSSENDQSCSSFNNDMLSVLGLSQETGQMKVKQEFTPEYLDKLRIKRRTTQTQRYSPTMYDKNKSRKSSNSVILKKKSICSDTDITSLPGTPKQEETIPAQLDLDDTTSAATKFEKKDRMRTEGRKFVTQIKESFGTKYTSKTKYTTPTNVRMCVNDILLELAEDADPRLFDESTFSNSTDFWNAILRHAQKRYIRHVKTNNIVFETNSVMPFKQEMVSPASSVSSISNPDYLAQFLG